MTLTLMPLRPSSQLNEPELARQLIALDVVARAAWSSLANAHPDLADPERSVSSPCSRNRAARLLGDINYMLAGLHGYVQELEKESNVRPSTPAIDLP